MTGPKGPYRQIKPGMYLDATGAVVFNTADILAELDMEDTPLNRQKVMDVVEEMIQAVDRTGGGSPMKVMSRTPDDPTWRAHDAD